MIHDSSFKNPWLLCKSEHHLPLSFSLYKPEPSPFSSHSFITQNNPPFLHELGCQFHAWNQRLISPLWRSYQIIFSAKPISHYKRITKPTTKITTYYEYHCTCIQYIPF